MDFIAKRTAELWLLGLGLLLVGCDRPPAPALDRAEASPDGSRRLLEPVTLDLNWLPEVEHGGYYAALVRGYYRDQGLEVTIRPGGANAPVLQEVAAGRTPFGVINADNLLFGRAQQAPVVALMAPLQTSPRCLLVHAKSGIKTFDDLQNITLAVTPGAAFAQYLRTKVPLSGVKIVPYGGNVQQFLLHDDYAQQGYVFSEPYVARERGAEPHVLMLADLGFNPYTSLLFTNETTVRERPDLVRRMVAATVAGWQDYLRDPQPTNERIHELNPQMDLPALAYGAEAIAPLVLTDETRAKGLGYMTLERWQTLAEQLVDSDQLTAGKVDPSAAFTIEFLPPPGKPPADNP